MTEIQGRFNLPELADETRSSKSYWRWYCLVKIREAVLARLRESRIGPGSKVIDLGCGNRPYESLITATGASYTGVDIPGNARADLTFGADGGVPAEAGAFDAVLSSQVLEHVVSPQAYLSEARRLLKPGGQLILSTHGMWIYHAAPNDFWRWTSPGLRLELERAGFKVLNMEGHIGLLATGLHFVHDALYKRLYRRPRVRRWFVWLMQSAMARFDRASPQELLDDAMIYSVLAEPVNR